MGQQELPFIVGGNAKWCSYFGTQSGDFLQNQTSPYHNTQQLCSLVVTQRR